MKTAQQSLHNLALQSTPATRARILTIAGTTVEETRRAYVGAFTQLIENPECCPGSQVYIKREGNRLSATMYQRKATAPSSHHAYRNEAQMMSAIEAFLGMVAR